MSTPRKRAGASGASAAAGGNKRTPKKTSRTDRVQIQGYFPEDMRKRLKMLAAKEGRTLEDVLGEAIRDVLEKYKVT